MRRREGSGKAIVIPAQAGIQLLFRRPKSDARFRGHDKWKSSPALNPPRAAELSGT
jgi:hypothetical protein